MGNTEQSYPEPKHFTVLDYGYCKVWQSKITSVEVMEEYSIGPAFLETLAFFSRQMLDDDDLSKGQDRDTYRASSGIVPVDSANNRRSTVAWASLPSDFVCFSFSVIVSRVVWIDLPSLLSSDERNKKRLIQDLPSTNCRGPEE